MLVANAAFGISNVIVLVAGGYVTFVVVVGVVEVLSAGRPRADTVVVDLTEPVAAESVVSPIRRRGAEIDDAPDVPIRRTSVGAAEIAQAAVAAAAAAGIAEFTRVAVHMQSLVGLTMWWYTAFVAIYFLLARDHDDAEVALDRVVTVLVWSVGIVLIAALAWMLATVVTKGASKFGWTFLTSDLSKTGPLTPGGGAEHAIIGTAQQVGPRDARGRSARHPDRGLPP